MAFGFLVSLVSQLFSNAGHTPASSLPAPWSGLPKTSFSILTTKSPEQLVLPHKTIANGQFVTVFFFCLISLYGLLILPYPRTTRGKQILAFPLLATMVVLPLFFTCPFKILHLGLSSTAIAVATRMLDLYYVQPWTGIPSHYCRATVPSKNLSPLNSVVKSKGELDSDASHGSDSDVRKGSARQGDGADTFLMWDMERFKLEMWAPLRRISGQTTSPTSSTTLRWQDLAPTFVFYTILLDLDIFLLSFLRDEDVKGLTTPQYVLFMMGFGTYIMIHILGACLAVAIVYSMTTGQTINTSEWTMLENRLPCFARTPAEFWITWHSLFRYLWVDLGFLPMRRLCESHLGPERVGLRVAKAARETLPILAVFALSGILHAYTVYAAWRESVWSQILYFMMQGIAVVLTKSADRSPIGTTVRDMYNKGGRATKLCMWGLAMALMLGYHTATLPMFIAPYSRHNMCADLKHMSVLWWMYGR